MRSKKAFRRRVLAVAALACAPHVAMAQARAERVLPEVKVEASGERADGPVQGYNATRSSTATRTDTPLREVPASIAVIPAQLIKDTAMQSLGDAFRYAPGVLVHQGEGNRDQIVIRGNSTTADFYVNGVRDDNGLALHTATVADLLDLRVDEQVRITPLKRALTERRHLFVEQPRDPADLRLGDPQPQRLDQLIDAVHQSHAVVDELRVDFDFEGLRLVDVGADPLDAAV